MWKHLNKGISTPIAIAIVLILVIIVGGFTWWQYEEIRKEEVKDETANWEIYKNEEYGFEVKYPEDWIESTVPSNPYINVAFWEPNKETEAFVSIEVYRGQTKELLDVLFSDIEVRYEILKDENVSINNIPVRKFHLLQDDGKEVRYKALIDRNREENIIIMQMIIRNMERQSEYSSIYDKMLSTFRFIEGVEIPEKEEIVKITEETCEDFLELRRDSCYSVLARQDKDIEFCEKIQNQHMRESCYKAFALLEKDISICDKITERYEDLKWGCYRDVAVSKEDASICEVIEDKEWKEACYSKISIAIGSLELCEKAGVHEGMCYKELAVQKEDPSICERIHKQESKDTCYYHFSGIKPDASICEKIHSQEWKGLCYRNVAVEEKDPSFCKKIYDQENRDWCYIKIIEIIGDVLLCDKVEHPSRKDACYKGSYIPEESSELLGFDYAFSGPSGGEDSVEVFDNMLVFKIFDFVGAGQCDNNKLRLEKRGNLIKIFFEQENCKVYTQRYSVAGEIKSLQPGIYIVKFYGSNRNKVLERKISIE